MLASKAGAARSMESNYGKVPALLGRTGLERVRMENRGQERPRNIGERIKKNAINSKRNGKRNNRARQY